MKTLENETIQGPPDWKGPWKWVIVEFLLKKDERTGKSVAQWIYEQWNDNVGRMDNPLGGLEVELAEELVRRIRAHPDLWWTREKIKEASKEEKEELLATIKSIEKELVDV